MNIHRVKGSRILFLSAVAITLFMGIPRLVILSFLKTRSYQGAEAISWWDFAHKSIYGFLIACLFLWLNVSRRKLITRFGKLDMGSFAVRLVINLLLFILIRFLSLEWQLYGSGAALSPKLAEFLFTIHLVLEISFCILAAEIYRLVTSNQSTRLKNEALERMHAETSFEVLKSKVNPHFLFNSLNTIHAMIDKEPEAAKRFVSNMSQVYRHILNGENRTVVSLAEELEFALAFGNMLQERHGNSLNISIDIAKENLSDLLPPVSLQILLENAIKHNVVSSRLPLAVHIHTQNGRLVVSNPIQEKRIKEPSTGTGLHNLNQRYLHLCNQGIDIQKSGSTFRVSLPLLHAIEEEKLYQTVSN